MAFSRYRLETSETNRVMTAPQAARIGSVGWGSGAGAGRAAVYGVHDLPSQYLTPAWFHGSGNQPVGVGNIVASVGAAQPIA